MERRKWLTWVVGQEVADRIYDAIEYAKERGNASSDQQCYFISGSFCWGATTEGYDYWAGVNAEIRKYFATKISPQLTSFLTKKSVWTKFLNNFNPQEERDSYDMSNSFIWSYTPEGFDFWSKISGEYYGYVGSENSSITNSILTNSDYENRLQGEESPRGERGESGRSGVCCEGDESRFRLSYTQHRKRIDFQKGKVGDFKVHISSRHPVLL